MGTHIIWLHTIILAYPLQEATLGNGSWEVLANGYLYWLSMENLIKQKCLRALI